MNSWHSILRFFMGFSLYKIDDVGICAFLLLEIALPKVS